MAWNLNDVGMRFDELMLTGDLTSGSARAGEAWVRRLERDLGHWDPPTIAAEDGRTVLEWPGRARAWREGDGPVTVSGTVYARETEAMVALRRLIVPAPYPRSGVGQRPWIRIEG